MDVLIYLLPLALILGFIGLMVFMWTLRSGQYDDMDGAAWRAILDDDQDLIPRGKTRQDGGETANPQEPVDKR
jgi:cbb3-type cytochrome oxidase maturation protein